MIPVQILVVEDEEIVAMDIQRTLQALGYLVPVTAASGEDAVKKAEESRPGLVLMDIRLRGDLDGVAAAAIIRERFGIPVVYLTAHADAGTLARAKITEPFGYVLKPFEERDLHTTIEMALYKHEMERKLRASDRRKDEFLAMLGHELRNPLAVILNSVEVLSNGWLSQADASAMLAIVRRQTEQMRHITDDLLDVTRIHHGKIVLKKSPLDVVPIVEQAAEDHRRAMESRGAVLRLELPDQPAYCEVDPTRLSQVIGNLLTNAAKFLGGPGEVTLSVRHHPQNHSASIHVRDTGMGIEAADLRDIFEPFVQGTQRLNRGEGGLGLGLALVRGLVELHGGRVTATSPGVGQGAEFTVELPLCAPPHSTTPGRSAAQRLDQRRRVLVVDDYPDALFAISKMLQLDGHEVFTAADGAQAMALARKITPQVILCDIGLPGMNGYQFADAVRSEPALKDVRLIAVSGYGREEDRQRAQESGFDHHLTKPVSHDQLKALVESRTSTAP